MVWRCNLLNYSFHMTWSIKREVPTSYKKNICMKITQVFTYIQIMNIIIIFISSNL